MLTGLIKFSAVAVCGLVGGALFGVFSSGSKTTLVTASSGEGESSTVSEFTWTRKVEPAGPVLKCQEHGKNYEVYLVTDRNQPDTENIEVGLEVRDTLQSNKVTWGLNASAGERWNEWELRVNNDDGIYMKVPADNKEFQQNSYSSIKCQESKFESTLVTGAGREQNINANLIKFTTSSLSVAQETSTKKEYGIQIETTGGKHIKWKQDFSPKVILESKTR